MFEQVGGWLRELWDIILEIEKPGMTGEEKRKAAVEGFNQFLMSLPPSELAKVPGWMKSPELLGLFIDLICAIINGGAKGFAGDIFSLATSLLKTGTGGQSKEEN